MTMNRTLGMRLSVLISLIIGLSILSGRIQADIGVCGSTILTLPFNDVEGRPFFCQIAAAYFSGLTNGTTATTYSPTQTVNREQMAAFISRTMDQSLKRGSKRVATEQWFTPQTAANLTLTTVGTNPAQVKFDGADLWVASNSGQVTRVRASDGSVLGTWSGATTAVGLVCALGKVFIIGATTPGKLYMIDPTQAPGTVTTLASNLGDSPFGIAFDGTRLWTANISGSVSLVSLNPTTVTTVSTGFSQPIGALYDGSNIWVTDFGDETIKKLNSNGTILQTITLDTDPDVPVFDGINIWVPNQNSNSISVVRVKDPSGNALGSAFVLATLTLNGLANPTTASFDGERILVTNNTGNSVSLWKAADLTPLGNFPTGAGTSPTGACSDGLNFWITLGNTGKLARF
jgi:hypothetical protein